MLTAAATPAASNGEEAITCDTLAQADDPGPTERRRAFERAPALAGGPALPGQVVARVGVRAA